MCDITTITITSGHTLHTALQESIQNEKHPGLFIYLAYCIFPQNIPVPVGEQLVEKATSKRQTFKLKEDEKR